MSMVESRPRFSAPPKIVIMGVAGCGKSEVGARLAERLGIDFIDGDDLHLPASIAKMSKDIPLEDEDRWPWLDAVGGLLLAAQQGVVVGCSALKRRYRDRIREGARAGVIFVHLAGDKALIGQRLTARTGHFMSPRLLESQFAALEPLGPDENAVIADIAPPLLEVVAMIEHRLKEKYS